MASVGKALTITGNLINACSINNIRDLLYVKLVNLVCNNLLSSLSDVSEISQLTYKDKLINKMYCWDDVRRCTDDAPQMYCICTTNTIWIDLCCGIFNFNSICSLRLLTKILGNLLLLQTNTPREEKNNILYEFISSNEI